MNEPLHPGDATSRVGSDDPPTPSRPRWVTVTFIVVGALVLLFVILKITGLGPGGGGHGPGMHGSAGIASGVGSARPPDVGPGRSA